MIATTTDKNATNQITGKMIAQVGNRTARTQTAVITLTPVDLNEVTGTREEIPDEKEESATDVGDQDMNEAPNAQQKEKSAAYVARKDILQPHASPNKWQKEKFYNTKSDFKTKWEVWPVMKKWQTA
jgi:hypothetical protein